MDLEALLEEYSYVTKYVFEELSYTRDQPCDIEIKLNLNLSLDIEALDDALPNVDLSSLSFDEFDPNDESQLEELGEVLDGVDLESVVEDLTKLVISSNVMVRYNIFL